MKTKSRISRKLWTYVFMSIFGYFIAISNVNAGCWPLWMSSTSLSPAKGASIGQDNNISFKFMGQYLNVEVLGGNINLYKSADNSLIETIDISSKYPIGSWLSEFEFHINSVLENNQQYYVVIDNGAFKCASYMFDEIRDSAGTAFKWEFNGYSDSTNTGCTAHFDYEVNNGTVNFYSTVTPDDIENYYTWSFGDGTTSNDSMVNSNERNPVHYYSNGTYTVCLEVNNGFNGTSCSYCTTITVGGNDSTNNPCKASFYSYLDTTIIHITEGYDYQFVNQSTGTNSSTVYSWDFGDGTTSNEVSPMHEYSNVNPLSYYTVCLTITTNDSLLSCTSTYCDNIYIGGTDSTNNNCIAHFDYEVNNGIVNFYSTVTPDDIENNYTWKFGDGTSSNDSIYNLNERNPVHYYSNGTYTVCLIVNNGYNGDYCTYCETITIGGNDTIIKDSSNCQASFVYNNSGLDVTLISTTPIDTLLNCIPTYTWEFGDGTTEVTMNAESNHTYSAPGKYYVCLTYQHGPCTDTYCETIIVGNNNNKSSLGGIVWALNSRADKGKVFLIGIDSLANTYSYIYNTDIDSGGYFHISDIEPGMYIMIAVLSPNSMYFKDYLPTFYGDVINWQKAIIFEMPGYNEDRNYDIFLVKAKGKNEGDGSIGGNVKQDGKKLFEKGAPIAAVEILLLNENDEALEVTYSDENGNFVFNDLAYGTYKIYGEVAGLKCSPITVNIDASKPDVTNVNVSVTEKGISSSISDQLSDLVSRIGNIYPNPTTDNASLEISMLKSANITMSVYNMVGQQVITTTVNAGVGSTVLPIYVKDLNEGIYTIELTSPEGLKIIRRFTKVN